MDSPQPGKIGTRQLTARSDAPDFRDFEYKPALVNLPPTLEVPKNLNIRDQGSEGACTGFGLAAAIDLLLHRSNRDTNVSTRMLYEMARRYDEWPGESYEGSSCRGAIKGWHNMGVCAEDKYPYEASAASELTVEAAKDARNNTIGAYFRLGERISDYHSALMETGVVYCSANVHNGWTQPGTTGLIKYHNESLGGHAFAIVGYDNRGFWVQNSWGSAWGLERPVPGRRFSCWGRPRPSLSSMPESPSATSTTSRPSSFRRDPLRSPSCSFRSPWFHGGFCEAVTESERRWPRSPGGF